MAVLPNLVTVAKPLIVPEEQIEQDDTFFVEVDITNNYDQVIRIADMAITLAPKDPSNPSFPGSLKKWHYYDEAGELRLVPGWINLSPRLTVRFRVQIQTTTRPGVTYPYPFEMEVVTTAMLGAGQKVKSAKVSREIEPD